MDLRLILAAFSCLIMNVVSRPDGAPTSACPSLLPQHPGKNPQKGTSPYKITAVKTSENKVTVTISSPHGEDFQGFVLQARSAADRKKLVAGEFENEDDSSKTIDCNGQKKNTLTHTSPADKKQVTAEWTSPVDEDIIFKATVAKNYSHFWENVDSDPVKMKTGELASSEISTEHSIYDGCGETNGCLGMPSKCLESRNCDVLLTYENTPDGTIQFALHGELSSSDYMAMALSHDKKMGDDFVTECIRTGPNDAKLRHSWNEGKSNTDTTEASVKYPFTVINDGTTTCTWIMENVTSFHGRTFDLLNEKYHILLAKGLVNGGIQYHHSNKLASSHPVQFFPNSEPTDSIETDDNDDDDDDDDSTDNQPREKRPAISTTLNGTDTESSSSQLTLSLLLFVLCSCGYLNFLLL